MRGIEAMREAYGAAPGRKCGTCCSLAAKRFADGYYKCAAYGNSASRATDWRLKWDACGQHGKPHDAATMRPLSEIRRAKAAGPIEGQLTME
jgi:hypothetical protein